jgi:uncharacterized protein (TIGR03435 family)
MHILPSGIVKRCRGLTVCNFRAKSLIVLFAAMATNAQQVPMEAQRQPDGSDQASAYTALRFDVVSVKLSVPSANPLEHRLLRITTPDRVRYLGINLKDVMMTAYGLEEYQVIAPDWMSTTDVDIEATMGVGTTAAQLRVMLQNLLVDRFKLTFHWGTKQLPRYSILVGRGGPKMRESAAVPSSGDSAPPPGIEGPPKLDADGFPISHGAYRDGVGTIRINGRSRLHAQRATMQDLARELSSKLQLAAPVTDETGLTAKYDFTLKFATPGWNGRFEDIPQLGISASAFEGMEPLPELAAALQSQLGLKLEQKRTPVDVLVVEHLEKTPTAN